MRRSVSNSFLSLLCLLLTGSLGWSQKVAVIAPQENGDSQEVAEMVSGLLQSSFSVQDPAMSLAAFRSADIKSPFNLSDVEARRIGQVVGTRLLVVLDSHTLRRSSSTRREYYESFVSLYTIDGANGGFGGWTLINAEGATPNAAKEALFDMLRQRVNEVASSLYTALKTETDDVNPTSDVELIDEEELASKGNRQPVPFKRVKPDYTHTAFLYDISATVDIVVDLDESGRILKTRFARWAGYGLDESVEKAVRSMNWRPAERKGKFVAARFLLRYNFKKPDKK